MYGIHGKENTDSVLPQRTNFNLRGHRAQVIFVCWNEPYQKLASVDAAGVIFVWVRYESRWSIELINDRGVSVRHFSWSHNGRLALIAYQDGFVLVGSVAGQRFWSASIGTESTILSGTWSPDDQQVYLGMSNGSITVLDIHGNLMAQIRIPNISTYYVSNNTVNSLAWNCAKFKMDDAEEDKNIKNDGKISVLAALCNRSILYLMSSYDDPVPNTINTGLSSCCMEWSNSGEYLAVGGSSKRDNQRQFYNCLKLYTTSGAIRYTLNLDFRQNHISSLTWGHNDRRIFLATGMYLHVGWVTRKPPSLSHLSRTAIRKCLHELYLVNSLPLPVRLKAQVSCLFSRTIYNIMGFEPSLRAFSCRTPLSSTRLFCTMIRLEDGSGESQPDVDGDFGNAATYILYCEFLGGLVPLLKGKRISKLRPEFVIFDPETANVHKLDLNQEESVVQTNYNQSPRRNVFRSPGSPLLARFSPRLARRNTNQPRRLTTHVDPLSHIEMLVQAGLLNPPSPEELTRERSQDELRRVRVGGFNPDELERRRNLDQSQEVNEWNHQDNLPEVSKLAEITSNIWGTRFKLTGVSDSIPEELGQITYRTSLLHLQPRQMSLLVTVLDGVSSGLEPEILKPPDLKADPEENYEGNDYGIVEEIPIAPMTPRLPRPDISTEQNRRSVLLENDDNSDDDASHHYDDDISNSTVFDWNHPIKSFKEADHSEVIAHSSCPSISPAKTSETPHFVPSILTSPSNVPKIELKISTNRLAGDIALNSHPIEDELMRIQLKDGVPYKVSVSRPRSFSASHIDFVRISVESCTNTRGQKHLSPRKLMKLFLRKRRSKQNSFFRKSRSLDSSPITNVDSNFHCTLPPEICPETSKEEKKDDVLKRIIPGNIHMKESLYSSSSLASNPSLLEPHNTIEKQNSLEDDSLFCLRFVRPKLSSFDPGKLSPFTARRWLQKPSKERADQVSDCTNIRGKSAPTTPIASPRSARRRNVMRMENCSPIRQIFSSPLMPRRWRSTVETSLDDASESSSEEEEKKLAPTLEFTNLETFQRQQLKNKIKRQGGLEARRHKNRPRQVVLQNKAPFWNEHSQVYQLDFGGRVTQESAKNFQIEYQGKQVMQFGRIDTRAYTLDFQYPFSPIQAFGVALANVTQRLK
ncbi:tubby-related protein 4-like isoform X2 [Artemia franciscana]